MVLEEAVKGSSEIKYSEESQVRLKLIADREDVVALEAKRKLLDKLRKGSDLATTGRTNANSNADADAEVADVDAEVADVHADADASADANTDADADADADAE